MIDRPPKIFYFCYRHDRPAGGQKHTYRHVDILNKYGFDAAVFHPGDNYRLSWFANNTKVINADEFRQDFQPEYDFVVLPEDLGEKILRFPGRKIIFNKNVFHGFRAFRGTPPKHDPYVDPSVVAIFAVSEHNRQILACAYPFKPIHRVFLEINTTIFRSVDLSSKRPLIACSMKGADSELAIYHIVKARQSCGLNCGGGFEWVFIENLSESQTADVLGRAVLLLFLSTSEGMGRLPLEALKSGCLLAVYDVAPITEFAPRYACFAPNDICGVVAFVEAVMSSFPNRLTEWGDMVEEGKRSAEAYTPSHQERELISVWNTIARAR